MTIATIYPSDYVLLNYINDVEQRPELDVDQFYGWRPFISDDRKYPGNVIQYLFMKTTPLPSNTTQNKSKKQKIFNELATLLTETNINTFSARDCASTIHEIATMLTSDLSNTALPVGFTDVLLKFYTKLKVANTQDIPNILWALAKLTEAGRELELDVNQVQGLFTALYDKLKEANPHSIVNTVRAAAKLTEAGIKLTLDVNQMQGLFTALYHKREEATSQGIANIVWAIAKLTEAGIKLTLDANQVQGLFKALYDNREKATSQDIANTVWAVAKLTETGIKLTLDANQVQGLFTALYDNREKATSQNIANTVWAVAKLTETGIKLTLDANQVQGLFTALYDNREKALPQEIANTVWAAAKLTEAGIKLTLDVNQMQGLLTALYHKRAEARPQNIVNVLWSLGIMNTITRITLDLDPSILNELIEKAIKKCPSVVEKNQVIQSLGLLKLDKTFDIASLIKDCRPISNLTEKDIAPHRKGAEKVTIEAFVEGFFVDLLIEYSNGKKTIIEFDGPHHDDPKQQVFDQFRDAYLLSLNYEIKRIKWGEIKPKAAAEVKASSSTVALFNQKKVPPTLPTPNNVPTKRQQPIRKKHGVV